MAIMASQTTEAGKSLVSIAYSYKTWVLTSIHCEEPKKKRKE
jgi:hypothetical protein